MQRHCLGIFAIACALLAGAAPALAAAETWVSGTGSDAGNCQISAPCRTFAFAHTQTNNHGAINVLSSGNFGPLTITKPISIVAQGVEAMINTGAGGAGIIVQAGGGGVISLRGLTIDLRGTANDGISFVSGAALHVQNCIIRRTTHGIFFVHASGTSELYVSDSVIADTSSYGVRVQPTGSANAKAVLDRVRMENTTTAGIIFSGNSTTGSITATVRDSVAAGNAGDGIAAVDNSTGTTEVMVDRSAAVNNSSTGIIAVGAGATIRIGDSTVTGNGTGLFFSGAAILSYGTNKVNGNGTPAVPNDGAPSGPVAMK